MKKLLAIFALLFCTQAEAQTINNLGAGRGSVLGTDLFPSYQGANPAVRPSAAQIAAYVYSLASGDLTANGTGTHTLATVNANVGSFGSATNCTAITVNAKGLITAASQTACTPAMSSVTGRATLAQLPQGAANSIWINPTGSLADMQNVAVPACANDGAHALVYVNGSGLACATLVTSAVPSVQTGTNYAVVDGDRGKVIYLSNAAAQTPTLPSAATLTNSNGWFVTVCNIAAGIQTLTPTTSTIGGAASLAIPGGSAARPVCWNVVSDGTNYRLVPAGNNNTIFSGTAAMGTSAISAGTCATVVTVSAPGVVTTDIASAGFNGDPTATTGYLPTAMLTLVPYPTADNVNVKACNLTASTITPAALTLNMRVNR